jgi:hypothetical protein
MNETKFNTPYDIIGLGGPQVAAVCDHSSRCSVE